jgi:hypothetical protein
MKTNKGIILNDKLSDDGRARSILREWGYTRSDIRRIMRDVPVETGDRVGANQDSDDLTTHRR